MHRSRDPLANPEELIRRVYAYVAYRIGDGADAEDVTSETFARAVRYRSKYDASKGEPLAWLLGIARRCIEDGRGWSQAGFDMPPETAAPGVLEEDALRRLELHDAVALLDERDRELIALRYGADLTAREIARLVGVRTNTVEVALHRALGRLRATLGRREPGAAEAPETRPVRV